MTRLTALSLTYCLLISTAVPAESTGVSDNARYALLVGIDSYPGQSRLQGSENDVQDVEKLLIDHFGFQNDKQHIVKLINEQASKDAIVETFKKHLVAHAKENPQGVFVFQFSGHGVQVTDDNGDEIDGRDESLVTAGAKDILRDDEINKLVQEISRYTANAVLIFDCCHSGTATRNFRFQSGKVRSLGANETAQLLKNLKAERIGAATGGKDADRASSIVPSGARCVALYACRPEQLAKESTDERHNGVLTRALVTALSKTPRPLTYRQLWQDVSARAQLVGQTPCIEGDWHRSVFGNDNDRKENFIVIQDASLRKVELKSGASSGIATGASVGFYPGSSTADLRPIAQGTVTAVRGTSCDVTLNQPVKDMKVLLNAKALLLSQPPAQQPFRIDISVLSPGNAAAQSYANALKEKLNGNARLQINGSTAGGAFDAKVVIGTQDQLKALVPETGKDAVKGGLASMVILPDGSRASGVLSASDSESIGRIGDALSKRAVIQALKMLNNSSSPLQDKFDVKFVRVLKATDEGAAEKTEIRPNEQGAQRDLKAGDMFQFIITNNSNAVLYPALLVLSASGKVEVAFPAEGNLKEGLTPGKSVKTDVFEVGEPFGLESFKFIVTTQPTDYSFLSRDGQRSTTRQVSRFGSFIQSRLATTNTRDCKKSAPPSQDEWATVLLECFTRP